MKNTLPPKVDKKYPVISVNVFAEDEKDPLRKATNAENNSLSMVGRITTDKPVPFRLNKGEKEIQIRVGGTATMISPCTGITNYHTFFGFSKTPSKNYVAHFTSNGASIAARAISFANYGETHADADDFVLFELNPSDCSGQFGYMRQSMIRFAEISQAKFTIVGFPSKYDDHKNPSQRWIHEGCNVTNTSPMNGKGTFWTSCAAWPGQSGAPIFYTDQETGFKHIIAMHSNAYNSSDLIIKKYRDEDANVAVSITRILSHDGNTHRVRHDLSRFLVDKKSN